MAGPTLDDLIAFMKKHGAERVDSITDEESAIKHFRATSRVYKEERETTSGECEKGMLYQLGKHLRRMDELDGTHEFRNLLSDLERGSDE